MDYREKSELRDGMRIDWDMPIKMDDGVVLRCDIFRPADEGKYPVILSLARTASGFISRIITPISGAAFATTFPEVPAGSTNKYQKLGGSRSGEVGA